MTISIVNGLPDIASVQKKVYPLIFTDIVSTQPTNQPIATAFGFKRVAEADDGSGWKPYGFSLDRWYATVTSQKLKTEISTEALEDLGALGIDPSIILDSLADKIADDLNIDIITSLNAISSIGSAIILVGTNTFNKGRDMYAQAHVQAAKLEKDTGCVATYIVAGGTAFGHLLASGLVTQSAENDNMYVCDSGLVLVNDKYSIVNYITVGVKKVLGDYEMSSLVFSPYNFKEGVDGLSYSLVGQDPKSMHPIYGMMARYALTAAPLEADQTGAVEIDWSNLGTLANSSKLSSTHTVA